jgi:hypothetical protein
MRIFLFGDSFTDNLFKDKYELIEKSKNDKNLLPWVDSDEIAKYLLKLNEFDINYKAKWFDDWLVEWGYDVYNFGKGACTIEDIIYQFGNLKNFKYEEGDRIIINWTHPTRFNWINDDNLNAAYIHSNTEKLNKLPKDLFAQQAISREISFFNNKQGYYLNNNLLPFMEYIIQLHSKYNPIVWTPFSDLDKIIDNTFCHFSFIRKMDCDGLLLHLINEFTIRSETNNIINDGHFGQYGNYYIALLFDEIIKNNLGPNYNKKRDFIFKNVLNRVDLENKEFITKLNII